MEQVNNEEQLLAIRAELAKYDALVARKPELRMMNGKFLEWCRFLLAEYDDERSAHNEHATELCQMDEEIRKLREERDKLINGLRKIKEMRGESTHFWTNETFLADSILKTVETK